MENYSLADIAAASNGEGFGGGNAWILIILFAMIFGGGGLGFGNGSAATGQDIQRAIDGANYNLQAQSAAIQANSTANTQKILDAIAGNRIADMQNQINALQLQNAVAGVVRYPTATTYTSGSNPFCGCGCGCANI